MFLTIITIFQNFIICDDSLNKALIFIENLAKDVILTGVCETNTYLA